MTNFQKMTRQHNAGGMSGQVGKRNRRRAVLAIACALMTVTAVGCGKAEEQAPVDLSSGNMEELQNETGEDSGANGADGKDEENF